MRTSGNCAMFTVESSDGYILMVKIDFMITVKSRQSSITFSLVITIEATVQDNLRCYFEAGLRNSIAIKAYLHLDLNGDKLKNSLIISLTIVYTSTHSVLYPQRTKELFHSLLKLFHGQIWSLQSTTNICHWLHETVQTRPVDSNYL